MFWFFRFDHRRVCISGAMMSIFCRRVLKPYPNMLVAIPYQLMLPAGTFFDEILFHSNSL